MCYKLRSYLYFFELAPEFAKKVQKKFQHPENYLMYHIIIGSTPGSPEKHFDFPDPDKAYDFLRDSFSELMNSC